LGGATLPAWVGPALIGAGVVTTAVGVYEVFVKPLMARDKEVEDEDRSFDHFEQDRKKKARSKKHYLPADPADAPTSEDNLKDTSRTKERLTER
jgi:hypothetical protein